MFGKSLKLSFRWHLASLCITLKKTLQFLQQISVPNVHPVYVLGFKPQLLDHESLPITTRPGLPSFGSFVELWQARVKVGADCPSLMKIQSKTNRSEFRNIFYKILMKKCYFYWSDVFTNFLFYSDKNLPQLNCLPNVFYVSFPTSFFFFSYNSPMTGFEPRTSGVRSNHTTNWATTTARLHKCLK